MSDNGSVTLPQAMWRGFTGRCPHCGSGPLFGRFLKVVDHCSDCSEALHHHRADDLPAYLVIVVVGHIVVPTVLAVETAYAPPYWLHGLLWLPLTVIMTLGLLQPVKGAVVGLQWQLGMDNFQIAKRAREARLAAEAACGDAAFSNGAPISG